MHILITTMITLNHNKGNIALDDTKYILKTVKYYFSKYF